MKSHRLSSNITLNLSIKQEGTVMSVIVRQLDIQLPMQSVPITIDVVSSNRDQGEVYKIMWWSLSLTCDRSVVFSGYSGFLNQ